MVRPLMADWKGQEEQGGWHRTRDDARVQTGSTGMGWEAGSAELRHPIPSSPEASSQPPRPPQCCPPPGPTCHSPPCPLQPKRQTSLKHYAFVVPLPAMCPLSPQTHKHTWLVPRHSEKSVEMSPLWGHFGDPTQRAPSTRGTSFTTVPTSLSRDSFVTGPRDPFLSPAALSKHLRNGKHDQGWPGEAQWIRSKGDKLKPSGSSPPPLPRPTSLTGGRSAEAGL